VKRRLIPALILVAVAVALSACGEKKDKPVATPATQRLTVMLDYFPNADHAPLYAAQAQGYFRQAGLAVKLQTPSDPATPLKLLAAGKVDLAISYEPELLLARDKGLRLVSVGALVQKPLTSIMSLGGAHITKPADLAGKRVGTAGIPYQSAYLKTILQKAGVDRAHVKETNVGFNLVPAMLSKKVDATLGAFWNYEGVQLEREHKDPNIIRMEQAGVPTYNELIIVARDNDLRSGGERVRRFLQALSRGAAALRNDIATGVDPLLKANKDLDRGLQVASVRKTLPAFFPADSKKPWGWQDVAEWQAYSAWMRDNHLVRNLPSPAALTNEFLPGEGV
jgi:putative hydroxymethylpyrimidine transport system substrate-binding protein